MSRGVQFKTAVEDGEVSELRYDSYLRISGFSAGRFEREGTEEGEKTV